MRPFQYYHREPRPNRVHVAGSVPNEEHRRKTQLKMAELAYRSEVGKAIIESRRWFTNSVYKQVAPQHNAFDRLSVAIDALSNYEIEAIHPVETKDAEQFGMSFHCTKTVTPERTVNFLVRVGLFKDIAILSPNYKNVFPFFSHSRLLPHHPSHPTNELKELIDGLGATITYSSLYSSYEYYVTPEGFVYHISVLNALG